MKRKHWLNTQLGAIVGLIPPFIGYAAASGSTLWATDQYEGIILARVNLQFSNFSFYKIFKGHPPCFGYKNKRYFSYYKGF